MAAQDPAPRVQVGESFETDWPGASRLATECVLNLWVLASQIETVSQASSRRAGFTSMAGFNVLTILHGAGEPLAPSVISERMMVTRGTMTGILATLERNALIRITRHPRDGRMRLAEITSEGIERTVAYRHRVHAAEARLMAALSPADQARFLRALARLQQSVSGLVI